MTERLARDQKVVRPDRFTDAFEGRRNAPGMLGILSREVQDIQKTGQEGCRSYSNSRDTSG